MDFNNSSGNTGSHYQSEQREQHPVSQSNIHNSNDNSNGNTNNNSSYFQQLNHDSNYLWSSHLSPDQNPINWQTYGASDYNMFQIPTPHSSYPNAEPSTFHMVPDSNISEMYNVPGQSRFTTAYDLQHTASIGQQLYVEALQHLQKTDLLLKNDSVPVSDSSTSKPNPTDSPLCSSSVAQTHSVPGLTFSTDSNNPPAKLKYSEVAKNMPCLSTEASKADGRNSKAFLVRQDSSSSTERGSKVRPQKSSNSSVRPETDKSNRKKKNHTLSLNTDKPGGENSSLKDHAKSPPVSSCLTSICSTSGCTSDERSSSVKNFLTDSQKQELNSKNQNSISTITSGMSSTETNENFQSVSNSKLKNKKQKPKKTFSVDKDDFIPNNNFPNSFEELKPEKSFASFSKCANANYINNDLQHERSEKMLNTERRNSPAPETTSARRQLASESNGRNTNKKSSTSDINQDKLNKSQQTEISSRKQYKNNRKKSRSTHGPDYKTGRFSSFSKSSVNGFSARNFLNTLLESTGRTSIDWGSWIFEKFKTHFIPFFFLVVHSSIFVFKLILALFILLVEYFFNLSVTLYRWGRQKFFANKANKAKESNASNFSLEKNIELPSTGEEAMRRLLLCKGSDPYCILGVCKTASDDEIKKFYRKQAMLVHPDKNTQPGAEEAFKILGHAFDLIGDPIKRKKYDAFLNAEEKNDAAMKEFSDWLTRLQEKMEEASNTMQCSKCGKTHMRYSTTKPKYAARKCNACKVFHSVKEGDMWAESGICGFMWHVYTYTDGRVFDITNWAICQKDNFKHLKANSHTVAYRIRSSKNSKPRNQTATGADLNDFLTKLFPNMSESGEATNFMPNAQSGPQTGTTQSKKKLKKKKK